MRASATCECCGATFIAQPRTGTKGAGRWCMRCRTAPAPQRFWRYVPPIVSLRDCWEWQGARLRSGHPVIQVDGRTRKAHRLAYELMHGGIPDGRHICHHCDNPSCVNPLHLYAGTDADNMRDRDMRLRSGSAKLTPEQVREIRRSAGVTRRELMARHGIGHTALDKVLARKSWKWVDAEIGGRP